MKKKFSIITGLFLLISVQFSVAQNTPDYFVGDWDVVAKATPNGDAKMKMHIERVDGKLTGSIKNEGIDAVKISKVEEAENEITIYFSAAGYDLYMTLKKKDNDNLDGRYLNMFDVEGKRTIEK
ncbi:hypothetical protein [Maribellus mangrovi]|uniref:hypothetical protein n=1 Tax=Maribellus mangrovi TaxID=3133146 RepID=UPI0030EBEF8E